MRAAQYRTSLTEVGNERLQRKLVRDVSKNPRITAKTPVNDLVKSGIVVSKKTITTTLRRNRL